MSMPDVLESLCDMTEYEMELLIQAILDEITRRVNN